MVHALRHGVGGVVVSVLLERMVIVVQMVIGDDVNGNGAVLAFEIEMD